MTYQDGYHSPNRLPRNLRHRWASLNFDWLLDYFQRIEEDICSCQVLSVRKTWIIARSASTKPRVYRCTLAGLAPGRKKLHSGNSDISGYRERHTWINGLGNEFSGGESWKPRTIKPTELLVLIFEPGESRVAHRIRETVQPMRLNESIRSVQVVAGAQLCHGGVAVKSWERNVQYAPRDRGLLRKGYGVQWENEREAGLQGFFPLKLFAGMHGRWILILRELRVPDAVFALKAFNRGSRILKAF
ncbi:hypothetical protein B0H16DRAFT_1461157 [Mycena metata]|uniref:Uncharacterized protein n=1 Tax=Mycena metata TaxID=1033252 RepID=A0AAD7IV29_9AGAR|nr:hypothetical protein B0H16DRAFT_1461157 [Mycena metata]